MMSQTALMKNYRTAVPAPEDEKSKYGRGNFVVSPQMKLAANRFGLVITRQKDSTYKVSSKYGADALDKLVGSFDYETTYKTHNALHLDSRGLTNFLKFLHQPLNHTARAYTAEKNPHLSPGSPLVWKQSAFKEAAEPNRKMLHSVLRFATTGSPTIPVYEDPELAGKESCECHADSENQMKDDDLWALEMELFNPANHDHHDHITSAIPNTTYDPARGFVLILHADFAAGDFHGKAQNQLYEQFWDIINLCTNNRYTSERPHEIVLSAGELQAFTQEFSIANANDSVHKTVAEAIYETRVQRSFDAIADNAVELSTDLSFLKTVSDKGEAGQQDQKLKAMMRATSALTPILTSEAMRRLWGRHKMTERLMGMDNPLDGVLEEIAVMQTVLSDYANRGDVTACEMQAITNRFAHVLSFGQDMMEALDTTAEAYQTKNNKRAVKGKATDGQDYSALRNAFDHGKHALTDPFLAGASHIDEDFLKPEFGETLDIFKKGMNQDGSLLMQSLRGGKDGFIEWTEDLVTSSTENPANFVIFGILAAYLYHIAGESTANATPEDIENAVRIAFGENGQFTVPPELVEALEKASEEAYAEAGLLRGYHYDYFGPFIRWKHYVSEDLVAGFTKTALGGIPTGYEFSSAANKTADNVGDGFFVLNFIQNFAPHAAFYIAVTLKGSRSGFFNGFKHILKLSAPVLNVAGHAALTGAEITPFKQRPHYDRLLLSSGVSSASIISGNDVLRELGRGYQAHNGINTPLSMDVKERLEAHSEAIAMAAEQLVALEDDVERAAEEKKLSLKVGWQEKDFVINGEVVTPLMQALREFDVTLAYISSKIGITHDWHREDLETKLHTAIAAVEKYKRTGDASSLQEDLANNLDQLIGAERRHTGESAIYSALFNEAANEKAAKKQEAELDTMNRFHSAWVGREKRKEEIKESRQEAWAIKHAAKHENRGLKFAERLDVAWKKVGRGANWGWDKTVRAARTIHETYHLIPGKKPISLAAVTAITTGALYDALNKGQNMFGDSFVGQSIDGFMDLMANSGGAISAAALGTVIALAYNFIEDTLGIHVVGGSVWLGTGAAEHHSRRKLLGPLNSVFAEKSGINIGAGLANIGRALGVVKQNHHHNEAAHSHCPSCE